MIALADHGMVKSPEKLLEQYRENIRLIGQRMEQGVSALLLARERARAMDDLVRGLFAASPAWARWSAASPPQRLCIAAVGGYGREELAPHSDVDLLFLHDGEVAELIEELTRSVVYPLWDLNIAIGYSHRTVKQCLETAEADVQVQTALMEARPLSGGFDLFRDMERTIRNLLSGFGARFYIRKIHQDNIQRYRHQSRPSCLVEPDLKEGVGGLRDYHTMLWTARAALGIRAPDELVRMKIISQQESRDLMRSLAFLWEVRTHLHMISARKNDRLTFEAQDRIARIMGFSARDRTLSTERFMQVYSLHTRNIHFISELFFQDMLKTEDKERAGHLGHGLEVRNGWLNLSRGRILPSDPVEWIRIFRKTAEGGFRIHRNLLRAFRDQLVSWPYELPWPRAAHEEFLAMLAHGEGTLHALSLMGCVGMLSRYIPEFEAIEGKPHYDTYHAFTLDMHLFYTVAELGDLLAGKYKEEYSELTRIMQGIPHIPWLLLAGLLHDIGKGVEGHHPATGAEMARSITRRMGLEEEGVRTVDFLLANHDQLVRTAQRRDMHDERVIVNFARLVGGRERLDMLYCLAFADLRATGPTAWNPWKHVLLRELYIKTVHVLERGEEMTYGNEPSPEHILNLLPPGFDRDEVESAMLQMTPAYLRGTEPAVIAEHIQLKARLKDELFVWEITPQSDEGFCQWSICMRDEPGIFSIMAGVLSLNRVNILGAQIHTRRNGIALDVFHVNHPDGDIIYQKEFWEKVARDLTDCLEGKLNLDMVMAQRSRTSPWARRLTPRIKTRVQIDNQASDFATVVEVYTQDRIGLLYDITRAFFHLGLDIHLAKVSTKDEEVLDVFYVRNLAGDKITDPEVLEGIKKKITEPLTAFGASDNLS
ncbi:MAG: [protein-PII] uridylyltransferase [Deltaproteobacteria bacterium]|nr:[protein-PII] uridylyltransferase [Deltaproteobacteria bacterium]